MARKTKKKTARGTKKKTARKKASAVPPLVVGSKVKEYIKSRGCKNSSEVIEAANAAVAEMLERACERAAANKRATVRAQDF